MKLFQSLHHHAFALLWSGQAISRLGDILYQIALAWFVVEKTGSASTMGNVLIFALAPKVLFLLIGGVAVDRFPRVPVMLLADLLRGGLASIIAGLALTQHLEIWHIYVVSMLFGLVAAFFEPAGAALLPELIPHENLASANSLNSLSADLVGVTGPALGALIIALGGTPIAFGLDALSFFISAILLWQLLSLAKSSTPSQQPINLWTDLRTGFTAVSGTPWLLLSIIIFTLLNFTGRSPMQVVLPFLAKTTLQGGINTLGLLYAAFSCGSISGALGVSHLPQRRRGLLIYSGLSVTGLMTMVIGLPITQLGTVIAIFIMGAGLAVSNLVWHFVIQERVPTAILGRVISINLLGSNGLLPLGFALAGWASDQWGPAQVFMWAGIVTTGLALIGLTQPAIRRLD